MVGSSGKTHVSKNRTTRPIRVTTASPGKTWLMFASVAERPVVSLTARWRWVLAQKDREERRDRQLGAKPEREEGSVEVASGKV
ncbi:hypothetical protein OUZ56_025600 [Daphnia magna]|uniref:Uncharacterized protein n=1 Tax=Daphnia magna TaxID=35525 RepID=A0ABQ9ZKA6_9CRUS|nr:hypothetical protein OUZ56_025600 [Daphnia magna]